MFNRVARRYDAANRIMSGGIDVLWRKKAIRRLLEGLGETPRMLDLGAGTLDGALEIARRVAGGARRGGRLRARDAARRAPQAGPRRRRRPAHRDPRRRRPPPALSRRRLRRRVLGLLRAQPARPAARAARAAPRGAPGRARRDPRVLPPRKAALLLRPDLQRPRAAARRLGGHRRSRGLPLPARFDRAFLLDAPSSRRSCARSGSRKVETKALFPSGVATMVVAS